MGKETNEEKEFSKNLDRLLTGEEVIGGEDVSQDYRTAINFAQKLIELRDEPSSRFKDQLKQRLLLQLTRQEVEAARQKERVFSFWEFLGSLIPQNPVWRTAAATLVIVLVAAGVLWRTGMFTRTPIVTVEEQELVAAVEERAERAAPVPEPAAAPPAALGIGGGAPEIESVSEPLLELEVVSSAPIVFQFGETAKIELMFKNTSSEPITIAPFPPAIQIAQAQTGEVIWSSAEEDIRLSLSPAETVSHTLIWNQQDDSGEQVVPGLYSAYVGDITIYQDTEPTETLQSFQSFNLLIQNP